MSSTTRKSSEPPRDTTMSTAIHVIPEPLPDDERDAVRGLSARRLPRAARRRGGVRPHRPHRHRMLDALGRSRIRYVSTRHEQVAAHAADGYARATGKPGVLLTHLGPGLTNAATGVANAALDSIPMVVIAGDVQSYFHGRHPHQEINLHQDADQFQIYRPFCKRVYRVDHARDLPRIMERAFHLAQTGRPGPVLVDVPMDVFSASLPVDAFNKVPAEIARPTIDDGDRRADRRRAGERGAPGALRRRRRAVGARVGGARRAGRGAGAADRAHADGQGRRARGPSAAARHDRLLGHADREREVPDGRRDPRRRHAPRRSELELLGSALHLRHPADAPDPHRRRRRRDRTQLPHRARRRRRREAGARRARRPRSRACRTARAARSAPRSPAAAAPSPPTGPNHYSSEPVPDASGAHPQRAAQGGARRRLHRHRRRLEQERRRPAVSDHRARARSSRRAAWRRWGSGRRRRWA